MHSGATDSVYSPPPCGEGLGVGVAQLIEGGATVISLRHPPPHPSPTPAAGLPASGKSRSDQTPAGRGLIGGGSRPSVLRGECSCLKSLSRRPARSRRWSSTA